MKVCPSCKAEKSSEEFYARDGYCKPCRREKKRAYYAKDPTHYRAYSREAAYGLSPEDVRDFIRRQGDKCGICRNELGNKFCVDHDHRCCPGVTSCGDCVRGLLCYNCNTGLAKFQESPLVMQTAIEWLKGKHYG